jgi:hypothetical protein
VQERLAAVQDHRPVRRHPADLAKQQPEQALERSVEP